MTAPSLLTVTNLSKHFRVSGGFLSRKAKWIQAVNGVSFSMDRGESLGLVGESGCGKSTLGRLIVRLLTPSGGSIRFMDREIAALDRHAMRPLRKRMQIIFQDPYASLNPRMTVFDTLAEPLLLHGLENRKTVSGAVLKLMDDVGLVRSAVRNNQPDNPVAFRARFCTPSCSISQIRGTAANTVGRTAARSCLIRRRSV